MPNDQLPDSVQHDTIPSGQALLRLVIGVALVAAAILAGGYVTVAYNLRRYTDVHTFDVRTSVYVLAGITLLAAVLIVAMVVVAGVTLVSLVRTAPRSDSSPAAYGARLSHAFRTVSQRALPISGADYIILLIAFILYTMLLAPAFGGAIYARLPGYFGGGRPATVQLVPAAEASATGSMYYFPVCMLAELTDGWLVLVPETGEVSIIKDADISVIRDYRPDLDCDPPGEPVDTTPAAATDDAESTPDAEN